MCQALPLEFDESIIQWVSFSNFILEVQLDHTSNFNIKKFSILGNNSSHHIISQKPSKRTLNLITVQSTQIFPLVLIPFIKKLCIFSALECDQLIDLIEDQLSSNYSTAWRL